MVCAAATRTQQLLAVRRERRRLAVHIESTDENTIAVARTIAGPGNNKTTERIDGDRRRVLAARGREIYTGLLAVSVAAGYTLTDTLLISTDGMSLSLSNITGANLTDSSGGNTFGSFFAENSA